MIGRRTYRKLSVWVLPLLMLPAGCIAVGGTERHEPLTLGRQLMDLKAARDNGAISNPEYDAAKSKLLGQN